MKPYFTITLYILLNHLLFSQVKGDYIWLGGIQPYPEWNKSDGHVINFNEKNKGPQQQDTRYGFTGNNTSICDKDGNLLFYTNGCSVINKYHQVMPNGAGINAGEWFDKYWKDCMYGYPGPQDVMILPDPNNKNGYYVFHKSNIYYPNLKDSFQLHYSYIDMEKENVSGDVIVKNKRYYNKQNPLYSYFTAIKHKNKKDWWILQPIVNDSIYLTFLLNENGIHDTLRQNTHEYFDDFRSSAGGSAKFSPDGTKYALYGYTDQLHIYNFDRQTGLLSHHQKINIYDPDSIDRENVYFSSVEWSPNGRFVYCASYLKLHQVDTWASNVQDGVRHIADYDGSLDPFPNELFLMAQAPDCKIYMVSKNGSYSLHVINKPDELGTACDFVQHGVKLPNSHSGTLPNFPRFRVDEVDKCDPTITSVFEEVVYYRREIDIYPNPSSGLFTIKLPEAIGKADLVITDIYGNIIYQKAINHSIIEEVDISHATAGRYNIEVYPEDNKERIFYGRQVVKI